MPYQKGQTGNPGGRPKKGTALSDILRRALAAKGEDGVPVRKRLMRVLIDLALQGDLDAIKLIFERVDGKVPDTLNTNQQGGLTIRVEYVDSDPPDAAPSPRSADGEEAGEEV